MTRTDIESHVSHNRPIYIVKGGSDEKKFTLGTILLVNNTAMFRVTEVLPFASVDKIPDVDAILNKTDKTSKSDLVKQKSVLHIRLDPVLPDAESDVDIFKFGEKFTSISGSYVKQTIVLNVKQGDRVKRGDIIAYNSGFFEPDLDSKQVTWKHGVMASVAMIERSETLEDSCAISKDFGDKIAMSPGHVRVIKMTNKTVLHNLINVGDHVETTDYLCSIEDSDIDALTSVDDPETVEFLAELNRKTPRAKYPGKIAEIEFFHACEYADLHPTLQQLARKIAVRRAAYVKAAQHTKKADHFPVPQRVPVGTKYQGVDFEEGTVAIMITITEDIGCGVGDKLVVMSANKTVVGAVMDKPAGTESGLPVDILFAGSSVGNRIVLSPFLVGIGNRCLQKLEEDAVAMYFEDKK